MAPRRSARTLLDDKVLDGHNRHKICEKHGIEFDTALVELEDRDHAKLWIEEHQVGRRNITDDQRTIILDSIRERRAAISRANQAREAGKEGGRGKVKTQEDKSSPRVSEAKERTRTAVAKEFKIPERKLRAAQEIKKAEPKLSEMVRGSEITLVEAKKLSVLPAPARKTAIAAVEAGKDVRTAIREAKKEDYNAAISAAKPQEAQISVLTPVFALS